MFDSIVVSNQRSGSQPPLDIGFLIETMLFYSRVEIFADYSTLKQLIGAFGIENLLELIEEEFLIIKYQENYVGIYTQSLGNWRDELYEPVVFDHSRGDDKRTLDKIISEILVDVIGRRAKGRTYANRLIKNVNVDNISLSLIDQVRHDFSDQDYVNRCALRLIKHYVPIYEVFESTFFRIIDQQGVYKVETNLDFDLMNKIYEDEFSITSSYSPGFVLNHIFTGRNMLVNASTKTSEIATDVPRSIIISEKLKDLINKRLTSEKNISSLQEFIFDNNYAIREAVNVGEYKFSDILVLIKRARKFKSWLREKPDDGDLVKEYYKAVISSTWVESLPYKIVRWILFTGIGLGVDMNISGGLGTATGVLIGMADTFILDKIVRGWKPNQFIKDDVNKLLTNNKKKGF